LNSEKPVSNCLCFFKFTTWHRYVTAASAASATAALVSGGAGGFAAVGWTKVGPRDANFESDATKSVNDAIVFPSLLPPGRFSHLSLSIPGGGCTIWNCS
jgi:hypothetical protein